jgi:hypothetical protein
MVGVSRVMAMLVVTAILAGPLHADVIPSRRAGDVSDSSAKIQSRLEQLGVGVDAAKEQVRKLTDDQTRYFAQSPERIQLVGQTDAQNFGGQADNMWWEWLFGIGALVGAGVIIYFAAENHWN